MLRKSVWPRTTLLLNDEFDYRTLTISTDHTLAGFALGAVAVPFSFAKSEWASGSVSRWTRRDAGSATCNRCHFGLSVHQQCEHLRSVRNQPPHGPDDRRGARGGGRF